MKRLLAFLLVAVNAVAWAQSAAAPPSAPAQIRPAPPIPVPSPHPEAVGASEAVITVHGLCPNMPDKSSAGCTTVVTKEQFEKIMGAVNQAGAPMPPASIRNLAERYVQIMAFASQAEKLGLDKDPRFQELMRVTRMNMLAESYRRQAGQKETMPSEAEIEDYYHKNTAKFEQVKLGRIFIPRTNSKAPQTGPINDFEQRAEKMIASVRERAAKGEELDKLAAEAYKTLGIASPPPNTDAGTRRRSNFPQSVESDVFALKLGECTRIEPEPAGFMFYRLQGRETLPLAQVKSEILAELQKEHLEAANKEVLGPLHTDLNETYFGPRSTGTPLTIPPPRGPQVQPHPAQSSAGAPAGNEAKPAPSPASPK